MKKSCLLLVMMVLILAFSTPSLGSTVFGVPYDGSDPNNHVGIVNGTTGEITFYIPLSQPANPIYGVGAGTSSDWGGGYGYNNSATDALQMFLAFDTPDLPSSSASLSFIFSDLDLEPNNDPYGFREDVQFYFNNGSTWQGVSGIINDLGDDNNSVLPYYTVGGSGDTVTIFFPDVAAYVNANDPFLVELDFSSDYLWYGRNTPETLTATLDTTAVPIPASLWLLGVGIVGVTGLRRRAANL